MDSANDQGHGQTSGEGDQHAADEEDELGDGAEARLHLGARAGAGLDVLDVDRTSHFGFCSHGD